jgi:hypothetical protein
MMDPLDEGEQAERRWRQATRRPRRLLILAAIGLCLVAGAIGFALALVRPPATSKLAQPITDIPGPGQAAPQAQPEPTTDAPSPSPTGPPATTAPPTPSSSAGAAMRDGSLEFNVRAVLCGQDTVGNGSLYRNAVGDYCIVTVTVRNVGDKPVTLAGVPQRASTTDGRQFPIDWTASVGAVNGPPVVNQPIPPQGQLETVLAFDVAEDATLTSLTLHDAPDSPGVTIAVR